MMMTVRAKYASIIHIESFTPVFTRWSLRAPRFCPQYVAMATPMFSRTQVNRYLMRIAAVKDATYTVPRALFALCSMMIPMEVMENCSPIGMPLFNNILILLLSKLRSSPVGTRIGMWRFMNHQHNNEAKTWLRKVAIPAPSTPIPSNKMNTMSSRMFSKEDAMRK